MEKISKCTFGKIFKVEMTVPGLEGVDDGSVLAVSDPHESGQVELLLVAADGGNGNNRVLVQASDVVKGAVSPHSYLHMDKPLLLDKSILSDQCAEMSYSFMDMVLREAIRDKSMLYYDKFHKPKQTGLFIPGETRINYAGRVFDENEILNLVDASLDFWLTTGKYAEKFEREFEKFIGIKHCSLANSGSSANLLAFMSLTSSTLGEKRISKGDEVITLAAGFPTTVAPIIQYGAIPVFVDVSLPTYNINTSFLEEALSVKTKAVMIAHTLGNPFNIKTVKDFCDKHDLWLIEDNCDALGAKYFIKGKWENTGTVGHIGTSSFYPPHHMTMGEGGAVYTNDIQLKRIVESLRDWGRDCWCASGIDDTCRKRFKWRLGELPLGYDHKYIYGHFGYNLKVTDMQAAVGCAQLKKLPDFIEARNRNWRMLREGLEEVSDYLIMPEPTENSEPSWFGFMLTVREDAGFTRDELVKYLESVGIQTRMLFAGNIIKHPCFDEMRRSGQGYKTVSELPVTNRIMHDTFWVGVYPGMNSDIIEYMIETIHDFIKK